MPTTPPLHTHIKHAPLHKHAKIISICLLGLIYLCLAPRDVNARQFNLTSNFYYEIETVRLPGQEDGDFTIRLTSPSSISGCYDIEEPSLEIVNAKAVIYVRILEEGRLTNLRKRQYGHFECEKHTQQPTIDLTFNKNTFEKDGTKRIDISSNAAGKLFDLAVETDEHKVTLTSKLMSLDGQLQNLKNAVKTMEYWYYPEGTLILSTDAPAGFENIQQKVKQLATSRGLVPLETVYEDYQPAPRLPSQKASAPGGKLIFVDTQNTMKDKIPDQETVILGEITTSQTFLGVKEEYQKQDKHAVFARRPGLYD